MKREKSLFCMCGGGPPPPPPAGGPPSPCPPWLPLDRPCVAQLRRKSLPAEKRFAYVSIAKTRRNIGDQHYQQSPALLIRMSIWVCGSGELRSFT